MNIVLFGKNGQLGKALQKTINLKSISRKEVNFLNSSSINNFFKKNNFDLIINAAAFTNVDKAENMKKEASLVNTEAPYQIALSAKKMKIPMIHFSTDYVFDGSGKKPWKTIDKTNPISVYGKTKALGEKKILSTGGLNYIIRTSWLFSSSKNNFVYKILNSALKNKEIFVVDDQISGPTSVNDLAKLCKKIIKEIFMNNLDPGIYHFSGTPYVSRFEFAKMILSKSKIESKINIISSNQAKSFRIRPKNSRLNCKKIEKKFGINLPKWEKSLGSIIKEMNYNK